MTGRILLYRGDSKKIEQFNVGETSEQWLVGQGIYLTTVIETARSYACRDIGQGPVSGHLSCFSFDSAEFEKAMLNIFKKDNRFFWGLLHDNQIPFGVSRKQREAYIEANLKNRKPVYTPNKNVYRRIRLAAEPLGYKGLEYNVGSGRGFCIWNDDWVNKHRI